MPLENPFAILTFIAAPAILTNASSVLALQTSNRFARNVDRMRAIIKQLEDHRDPPPAPLGQLYRDQIAPPRMDHMLITAEEVGESTQFYMDVLGFRITEQLLDGNGHQLGTWMERSHSPHDLAVVHGTNGGLHHFAYWLDDWDDVRDAADVLAYNGIQLDVGPTRHGITRGSTIYFFDPLGTRNEVFTGGYRPDPDFPTLTWTEDNIGRAVFYYEGELNDRFMKVHT